MGKFMIFCALGNATGAFNINIGSVKPVKLFSLGTIDSIPNRLTINGIDLSANTATIKNETTGESFTYDESAPPVLETGKNYTLTIERDDGTAYYPFIKSIIPDGESEIKIVNPVIISQITSANLTEVTTNPEGFATVDGNRGYNAFDSDGGTLFTSVDLRNGDLILYSRRPMLLKALDYRTSGTAKNYFNLNYYGSNDKENWVEIDAVEVGIKPSARYAILDNDTYYNYYKVSFKESDYTSTSYLYGFYITEAYFSE